MKNKIFNFINNLFILIIFSPIILLVLVLVLSFLIFIILFFIMIIIGIFIAVKEKQKGLSWFR